VNQPSTFQVYNASAGSGKTFTLVKEYLKVVLTTEDRFKFQQILAVTFTNKAAAEMKERIVFNLQEFSEGKENDLLLKLVEETQLTKEVIQQRSSTILDAILRNYSAFAITTIDSFTHKIIKSFAFDLGLNLNFEVELDSDTLLQQAVDILISKIGIDNEITNTLIEYAKEKAQEDKSWDIAYDLNEFAKILLKDEDAKHFKRLSNKTISDFTALKKKLKSSIIQIEKQFISIGEKGIAIIETMELQFNDFYRSILPNHFFHLKNNSGKAKFFDESKLKERIEERTFYAKSKSDDVKAAIEGILPELLNLYYESEKLYQQFVLSQLALKSIVPLAVLTKINAELTTIKEENNIRLISEFNQLISNNIQDEPAPFIYERIGQKFMHYFIDEMQDTSVLQWQNLIPLIDNVLAQENSNLLLVGDGKQAIYRWRGSKAEQFIRLGSNPQKDKTTNPFQIPKKIEGLEINFRSFSEIIEFNNSFFQYVSGHFNNPMYQNLFIEGNNQKTNHRKGGFVSLDFLEKEEDAEENKLKYAKRVYEIILNLDDGFSRKDVCVLVRKKKDGVLIANYLSELGVDIVSSETLLLQNSNKVNFIVNLLQVIVHPNDESAWIKVLYFLHEHLKVEEDKHSFLNSFDLKEGNFFSYIKAYGIDFNYEQFLQLPFYEKIEEIIRSFQLIHHSDAYIQFFLEVVYELQKKQTNLQQFLEFWERKKESLSIVAPASENAVQIMTIHKSKGLEFPVVIVPNDIKIYDDRNQKTWYSDLPREEFNGFDELLISSTKNIKYTGEKGETIYHKQREESELDNINLLYVAYTRTVEQLYVIKEKSIDKKGSVNLGYTSGILIAFLKENGFWEESKDNYQFGNPTKKSQINSESSETVVQNKFISNSWQQHNIYMVANASKFWDTEQGKAIDYGNLIHEMFAKIFTKNDVIKVVQQYVTNGFISDKDADSAYKLICKVVDHPKLQPFYSDEVLVFNEREIKTSNNNLVIPDRLVFKDQSVTIIDYKTGKPSASYHQQLNEYHHALESMGFIVEKKLLIYMNEEIEIEEI
jgi:ATP-dependent exoDNAse (exonuclease V) beta subunit